MTIQLVIKGLEEVEQDFNNEEDEESARIIAGVKSMFEAIFDL